MRSDPLFLSAGSKKFSDLGGGVPERLFFFFCVQYRQGFLLRECMKVGLKIKKETVQKISGRLPS